MSSVIRKVMVRNARGLHARAAAKFVETLRGFAAEARVATHAEAVDADSIMELLMLAAGPGTELTLETRGPDAEAAADALEALVAAGFHETE